MKILILSVCGRSEEAEDLRRLNLYLASLKKHIVPHFETKVLLLNTAISKEKTVRRIQDFGLEDVIDVRQITDMELPENSLNYWKSLSWYSRSPLNMNFMYDYARKNNFYEAKWIFHTDTDLQFLSNFKDNLEAIDTITSVNPKCVITLSGDTFPYNIQYKNKSFIFKEPKRINLYESDTELPWNSNSRQVEIIERTQNVDVDDINYENFIFHLQQQKNRNDFFGFTQQVGKEHRFDWNHAVIDFSSHPDLIEFGNRSGDAGIFISTSHDKGTLVQFQLQSGHEEMNRITLRVDKDMAVHYGPGWSTEDVIVQTGWSFVSMSRDILEESYLEYKHIWGTDYE